MSNIFNPYKRERETGRSARAKVRVNLTAVLVTRNFDIRQVEKISNNHFK